MDKARWDTFAAACGIVGVVLFVLGLFILGKPPDLGDDARTVANFYIVNRGPILWSLWFQGLGVLAFIWFIAALGAAMRGAGEERLAAAMGLTFAIIFAIGAVSAITRGALGFRIAEEVDSGVTLALYHLTAYMDTVSSVIGAGLYAAVAGAAIRSRFLPQWWGWLSGLAALWAVISSTAWSRDGFWSADGAGLLGFIVFLVWAGVTSILLTMQTGRSATPAA